MGTFVAAHGNKECNEEATNNPNLHKIKIEKATLLRVNIWILMIFSSHLIQSIQQKHTGMLLKNVDIETVSN